MQADQTSQIKSDVLSAHVDQPTQSSIDEDSIEFVLICKMDNARVIYQILSTLLYKKEGQYATVAITRNGIKFTVSESKSFQGSAVLANEQFQEYNYSSSKPQEIFRVNFNVFMDCLSIYGNQNAFVNLQMGYGGNGNSLALMLEENGVITNCGIRTLEVDELYDFNFRGVQILNKVIMEAEVLKEAFNEIDWSSQHVTILLSPEPPYFRLATSDTSGSCQVDYPKEPQVFETFECFQTQSNTYKLSLLQPAVKSLSSAHKTQMRINQAGILGLQHMIKSEDKNICFVDFFIAPEEVNDED